MSRIVMLVPSFPKLSETFIVNKMWGLLERGWDVHVVCRTSDGRQWHNFPALQSKPGIHRRVHRHWPVEPRWLAALLLLPALLWIWLRNPWGCLRYSYAGWRQSGPGVLRELYLDARLVELAPRLIHVEFGALAPECMRLKARLGSRLLVSFRGYDINYVGLEKTGYYDQVWQHSDAVHLLGEDLWHRAQRRGCPSTLPHALIPPAIDTARFTPGDLSKHDAVGTPERPLRIVSVGRLEWKKGYEYALEAVQQLVARGLSCEYCIVGEGAQIESLIFARHQLGLDETVTLTGALTPEGVRAQLAWADIVLHAAVSEGFCNAVIEAQAMALPVVTSDADGLPENVVDGVTGLVVPRRDPRALADALERLAGDSALRTQMGSAGRARVLEQFSLDDQISAFERLYRQLLAEEPPSVA